MNGPTHSRSSKSWGSSRNLESILAESQALRAALQRFTGHAAWRSHAEGPALQARVRRLLGRVRRFEADSPPASAHRDWFEVVQWNILHGVRFDAIRRALQDEPVLAGADLLSLNEVDLGLARSGNRDVAFDLARALGMHALWTALFLELEGGSDTEPAIAAQEQAESLFGLALLSRFPLGQAQRVELQTDEEFLFESERKVGRLVALVVEVLRPGAPFHAVVTHLDVHRTPQVRRFQMQQILAELPEGPAVLCGDLNTTTFVRGHWWSPVAGMATLALTPSTRLERRLLCPDEPQRRPREPLFLDLQQAGFAVRPFNDVAPSLDLRLQDVREYRRLPAWLRRSAAPLLRRAERRGRHRLDWIASRGFEAAPERPAFVMPEWMRGGAPVSDHAPIGCGLRQRMEAQSP